MTPKKNEATAKQRKPSEHKNHNREVPKNHKNANGEKTRSRGVVSK